LSRRNPNSHTLGEDVVRRVLRDGRVVEDQSAVTRNIRAAAGYLSDETVVDTAAHARGVVGDDAVIENERAEIENSAAPVSSTITEDLLL